MQHSSPVAAVPGSSGRGTLFEPGRNCMAIARAGRAAFVIHAEAYYRALVGAALRATHSIVIVGWDFDPRTRIVADDVDIAVPRRLGDFLDFLATRQRRLAIRVLDWDYQAIDSPRRDIHPLYGLGWKPHRRVSVHYDNSHPAGGSHHQNLVVVDDALAFSGGLDLACRRWDGRGQAADEPHAARAGRRCAGFHDAIAVVDGNAARVLARVARERWHRATGERVREASGTEDPWPPELVADVEDVDVAISRTVPETPAAGAVREVEALYLDMIAAARRSIYVENEYFTSPRIAQALATRLAEADPPEIVLVTRERSHGWLDRQAIGPRRARLLAELRAADRRGSFEAYCPRVPLDHRACGDLHSKIMVVDDEWLRVGSANLSNRSMTLDSECDVTLEARGRPHVAQAIERFRSRLLAEHLGVPAGEVRAALAEIGSIHATIRRLRHDGTSLARLADGERLAEPPGAGELASMGEPEPPVAMDRLIEGFEPDTDVHRRGPAWGKLLAIAAAIAMLSVAWRYTPLSELVTPERVTGWANAVGNVAWAPLVLMTLYTPAAFVMFPRPLITLFAVIGFGPVLGFFYSMTGILLAALATYYVGRWLPRDTVRRLAGEKLNRMSDVLRRRGLLAVLAVRIVPVAPFAVEGIVAGAIGIRVWHYTLGTFLGMLPGTLTTSVFGDQLRRALEDPSRINYWLVGGVVALFVAMTLAVRRWFIREHRVAAQPLPEHGA